MTARQTYANRSKEVQELIKKLQTKLKKHALAQKKSPDSWAHAGDLGKIKADLKEMNDFLR